MATGCLASCSKYCLICFNVIFFLGGGVVFGIGLWMVLDTQAIHTLFRVAGAISGDDGSYSANLQYELTPGVILQTGYILIAAGSAAIIFSFLGCCGALNESQCCLSLYAVGLMAILGLEVAVGIYAAVAKKSFEENAKSLMLVTLTEEYMNGTSNAITYGWNRMMVDLECCGVQDYQDFKQAIKWRESNAGSQIPKECCKLKDKKKVIPQDDKCERNPTQKNSNLYNGCFDTLKHVLQTHLTILFAVGIGIGLSQLLGIAFTFILCCSVDSY